jgi:hypothetical protein
VNRRHAAQSVRKVERLEDKPEKDCVLRGVATLRECVACVSVLESVDQAARNGPRVAECQTAWMIPGPAGGVSGKREAVPVVTLLSF